MDNEVIYNVIQQGDIVVNSVTFKNDTLEVCHNSTTAVTNYDWMNKTLTLFSDNWKEPTVVKFGNFKLLRVMTTETTPYKTTLKFC